MASINVSLSDEMRRWIEGRVESGDYHNASEYMRDLIRRDQDARARMERLRAHLAVGEADIAAGRFVEAKTRNDVAKIVARAKRKRK